MTDVTTPEGRAELRRLVPYSHEAYGRHNHEYNMAVQDAIPNLLNYIDELEERVLALAPIRSA